MPLFSIITVTLNDAEGLYKTCASVRNQTCHDYEWIIIDGASTDKTPALLTEIRASMPETIITSGPDKGLYDAMNKGAKQAKGNYLIFMNGGDLFAEYKTLEKIKQILNSNKYAFLFGDAIDESPESGRLYLKKARSCKTLHRGMFTRHQAMIYERKHFLNCGGYDLDYPLAADFDLTARFLENLPAEAIHYIAQPVCCFALGGLSTQKAKICRREEWLIRQKTLGYSRFYARLVYSRQTVTWALSRLIRR